MGPSLQATRGQQYVRSALDLHGNAYTKQTQAMPCMAQSALVYAMQYPLCIHPHTSSAVCFTLTERHRTCRAVALPALVCAAISAVWRTLTPGRYCVLCSCCGLLSPHAWPMSCALQEGECFAAASKLDTHKALVHIFFAQRATKKVKGVTDAGETWDWGCHAGYFYAVGFHC